MPRPVSFNWRTRIGSFKFPGCGGAPPTPTPTADPDPDTANPDSDTNTAGPDTHADTASADADTYAGDNAYPHSSGNANSLSLHT